MLLCMRTTIRLDDELFKQVKSHAARVGQTLTSVIEDALREVLARANTHPRPSASSLPTFEGDGLRDGVNLDDSGDLLEVMETSD